MNLINMNLINKYYTTHYNTYMLDSLLYHMTVVLLYYEHCLFYLEITF